MVPLMKSIQEIMRAKELEVLQLVEDALRQKEVELRQLQKNLQEALRLVNRLLETEEGAATTAPAEAASAVRKVTPPPGVAGSGATRAAPAWDPTRKEFP